MEEVYTCECGNQTFTVYDDRVQCAKCGLSITVHIIPRPWDFNHGIRLVKSSEGAK